jgi:hypothetical protein
LSSSAIFPALATHNLSKLRKSLPATKALVDLLNRAQPIIEQAEKLYTEAEPLIEEAKKEWVTVGPAAQILIDVISHHVNRGSSPAVAAETVRAALNGLEWCGKSERSRTALFLKPIQRSRPVDACDFRPIICMSTITYRLANGCTASWPLSSI